MTVELKRDDIGLLISLTSQEVDRVGKAKEEYGFCDPSYFYHLIDIRYKLLAMPLDTDFLSGFSDEEWQDLFGGKRIKQRRINIKRKTKSLNRVLIEQREEEPVLKRR